MENIVGYEAEKKRIEDIANILKKHDYYKKKGIYIPKGLLLSGPAGVGKTMLAHYLIDLSGAKLFSFSPSACQDNSKENAHKLKDLFEEAKKECPSIVFVDELNSYLPSQYFDSDRTNDFLSTLLKALDGDGYEGIMFDATCIDSDDIPSQALRSGRIDEHIVLSKPDLKTRKAIIEHYLSKIDFEYEVDTKTLAYKTSGFVGADIKNLVNMASRIAIGNEKEKITANDFFESIYSIRLKDIKRQNGNDDQQRIAIHEVGHLIIGKYLLGCSYDVTIDNYDYIKGIVMPLDDKDEDEDNRNQSPDTHSKLFYYYQIVTSLGGKAAEELYFDSPSSGCSADLDKCLDIIDHLAETGMLGFNYVNLANTSRKDYWSEKQRRLVEKKTKAILKKAYKLAQRILKQCPTLMKELVKLLLEKTVLVAEDSDAVFEEYGM